MAVIPTSNNLFEIFKQDLDNLSQINEIVVKSKLDRKAVRNISSTIKHMKTILVDINDMMSEIGAISSGISMDKKAFTNITDTIIGIGNLIPALSKISTANTIKGKYKVFLLRQIYKSLIGLMETLGDGSSIKIFLANVNTRLITPLIDNIDVVTGLLNKVSLKTIWDSVIVTRRLKFLYRRLFKLVDCFGKLNLADVILAQKKSAQITSMMDNIYDILDNINTKIPLKTILIARRNIRRIGRLLFGGFLTKRASVAYLIHQMNNKFDLTEAAKVRVISLLISKAIEDISGILFTIDSVPGVSLVGYWKMKWRLYRLRKLIKKTGTIIQDLASYDMGSLARANASIISTVLVFRNINVALRSIQKIGIFRKWRLSNSMDRLYKLFFGEGILFGVKYKDKRHHSVMELLTAFADEWMDIGKATLAMGAISLAFTALTGTLLILKLALNPITAMSTSLVILELFGISKLMIKIVKTLGGDDTKKETEVMISTLTSLKDAFNLMNEIVGKVPKIKDMLRAMLVTPMIVIFVGEYNWMVKKVVGDEKKMNVSIKNSQTFTTLMDAMKTSFDKVNEIIVKIPSISDIFKAIIALGGISLFIMSYIVMMKAIDIASKFIKAKGNNSVIEDLKPMIDTLNVLMDLVAKAANNRQNVLPAIPVIFALTMIMVAIGGLFLIISKMDTSLKKSKKTMRKIKMVVASIMFVLTDMIVMGIAIILGSILIGITITFIVGMLGLMMLLGLVAKPVSRALKTIALLTLCLAGLTLITIGMILTATYITINIGNILVMFGMMVALVFMLRFIGSQAKHIEKSFGAIAIIIGVMALLGLAMLSWAIVSRSISDPMLLVIVAGVAILLIGAIIAISWIVAQIPLKTLGIGALAMVVVGAIVFGVAYVMRQWADVANSVDDVDKLKKVMILGIGAITAVSAIVTIMGAIAAIPVVGPLILAGAAAIAGIMGAITAVAFGIAKVVQEFAKGAEMVAKLSRYGIKNEKDLATKLSIPLKALITKDNDGDTPLDIIRKLAFKKKNGKTLKDIQKYVFPFVASGVNLYNSVLKDVDTKSFDSVMTSSFGTMFKIVKLMQGDKTSPTQLVKIREIRKNITETRALIKQIDSTDIDKLKYASDMMANISRLSASIKGNFEGLADVINEKLVKAIEELKEQLEKLNNTPKSETTTPSPISKDMSQSGTPGALRKVTEANKPEPNKPAIYTRDINEIKRNINEILGTIRGVIDVSGMCIKTKEQ